MYTKKESDLLTCFSKHTNSLFEKWIADECGMLEYAGLVNLLLEVEIPRIAKNVWKGKVSKKPKCVLVPYEWYEKAYQAYTTMLTACSRLDEVQSEYRKECEDYYIDFTTSAEEIWENKGDRKWKTFTHTR